jgi:integrase
MCHGMKSIERETLNADGPETCTKVNHSAQFMAARDSRNRRIAGLCTRNGRYYGVLWVDRGNGRKAIRRFPLLDEAGEPIRGLAAAKEAFDILKSKRREEKLPKAGRLPFFADFAAEYLGMASTRAKKPATIKNETQALARWSAHLGGLRLDAIKTPVIKSYAELRQRAAGCMLAGKHYKASHPRTVSLELVVLRNVLRAAEDAGHLDALPKFPKIAKVETPRRALISPAQLQDLLAGCLAMKNDGTPVTKNGEQLRDFLRFLAFTGAREKEALRVRWAHVDLEGGRVFIGAPDDFQAAALTIGTGGTSKNGGSRPVDFNPQLGALLRELNARRAPDSSFLFPSPQRGEKDIPSRTLRESLRAVRAHVGLPKFGFHHLRVYFISYGVMSGVDFMTLAKWVGHRDGGVLIGKVYGDIAKDHARRAAANVTFGMVALSSPQSLAGVD